MNTGSLCSSIITHLPRKCSAFGVYVQRWTKLAECKTGPAGSDVLPTRP